MCSSTGRTTQTAGARSPHLINTRLAPACQNGQSSAMHACDTCWRAEFSVLFFFSRNVCTLHNCTSAAGHLPRSLLAYHHSNHLAYHVQLVLQTLVASRLTAHLPFRTPFREKCKKKSKFIFTAKRLFVFF